MPTPDESAKLQVRYRALVVQITKALRSLSLYPVRHPEAERQISSLYRQLSQYLERHPNLAIIFAEREVVVENIPFPELSANLRPLTERFETLGLERVAFGRGLTADELVRFFQLLLKLLKTDGQVELSLAMSPQDFPHIAAGRLSLDHESHLSFEDVSRALRDVRHPVRAITGQMKDLFGEPTVSLSDGKVRLARETVATLYRILAGGLIPMKLLMYRGSPDPDASVHAVNVCAQSMALARHLHLEEETVLKIGLGGLLHDIGLRLPPTRGAKPTAAVTLDQKKHLWEHPFRGAEILLATPGLSDLSALVALEHHIHFDGGGFPKRGAARQLNLATLITTITNTYDNLRRDYLGRDPLSLTAAIHSMDRRAGTVFHPLIYKGFRGMIKALGQAEE
jgi:HD-GYP domain-containing protein (c-di-GMP phosphodiesterase class II)